MIKRTAPRRNPRTRTARTYTPGPVQIFNHQGWAAVRFTSPRTREVKWKIQFAPADLYHFPPGEPNDLFVERVGLDGVNLHWREQYYLNVGYQVYLGDQLLGHTPQASFPVRGLNPHSNYVARVATVAEDGRESPRKAEVRFTLASLVPAQSTRGPPRAMLTSRPWRSHTRTSRA